MRTAGKEAIEPGDSTLCLVTTYGYDPFANKNAAQVRNCNGSTGEAAAPPGGSDALIPPPYSSTGFDAQGRFATSATNAVGHSETRVYDTRFGTVTSLTGPNGLAWKKGPWKKGPGSNIPRDYSRYSPEFPETDNEFGLK